MKEKTKKDINEEKEKSKNLLILIVNKYKSKLKYKKIIPPSKLIL